MGRKTDSDPTGQGTNRKKAATSLNKRLRQSKCEILAFFKEVPYTKEYQRKVVNRRLDRGEIVYFYDIGDVELAGLYDRILSIINQNMETSSDVMPPGWFYQEFIERPYREGSFEDIRDINQLIELASREGFIEADILPDLLDQVRVIQSPTYQSSLTAEFLDNYRVVKTLSSDTASQVYQQMWNGIQSGNSPREIASSIVDRFNVSQSRADRIARTGVNTAYNNAKLRMAAIASDELGVRIGNMHISALSATTRIEHARRHGLVYSVRDQTEWWNTGANRINCQCTVEKMLINPETGAVFNKKKQRETREQGKQFFGIE